MSMPTSEFSSSQVSSQQFIASMNSDKLQGSPKVLAIIAIVLGILGILAIFALPAYFSNNTRNSVQQFEQNDPIAFPYAIASIALGVVLSMVQTSAAFKCLRLDPQGRKTLLTVSCIRVLLIVFGAAVLFVYTVPKMQRLAGLEPGESAWPLAITAAYAGFCVQCLELIYFSLVLGVFSRPALVERFEGPQQ